MNYSLKPWNTFGINRYAKRIVFARTTEQLLSLWKNATKHRQPVIVLGEGSNVLFLDDFSGTVIINRIMGINVTEDDDAWCLHVGAGESWHHLVQFTLKNNMPGLENLALIPGCVGSSPIQNIGAYDVELRHVCQYVNCIELETGHFWHFKAEACHFGYRDSIFKHNRYQNRFVIIDIGLRLSKYWRPVLTHRDLIHLNSKKITPEQIFNFVCRIRMNKIPDPKVNGNAGSFFKNPIVSRQTAKKLLTEWPSIPHHHQDDGYVKIMAGWLIDQCQLKGFSYGEAAVHHHQALVLINKKNATSEDIIRLAYLVRQRVGNKFSVWLEPEVRFIGAMGEVDAMEIIT